MEFFDLHCDTVSRAFDSALDLTDEKLQANVKAGDNFTAYAQCFALFISDCFSPKAAEKRAERLYDFFLTQKDKLGEVTSLLTIENASALGGKLENLQKWKSRGCRMITLTWNGENALAYGASCSDGGLKEYGKAVISEMERLNIAVDLSHINEKSFSAAASVVTRPFAFSHSCCYAVTPHRRNVKDWQIKLMIELGGVIGLCFYPEFLGGDVFPKIYENICHILSLGGEKNICFGSDFDGAAMSPSLCSTKQVVSLYEYLSKRGLDDRLLSGIFYKNAENFFKRFYNR